MLLPDPYRPAHRCPSCRLTRPLCVCALAPRLSLSTRVIVLMHIGEWARASNSGHFVQTTLSNAQIMLHGCLGAPLPPTLDHGPGTSLVLFPGHGAKPLTPEFLAPLPKPFTLLVPDGNWNQTKAMMRRLPLLKNVQPVQLPGPSLTMERPRRNILPDRMSTYEAVAQTLGLLEGPEVERAMLAFFETFATRMLTMRGKRDERPATCAGEAEGQPSVTT